MDKEDTHTHTLEYYLTQKVWNHTIYSNMDETRDDRTKWSKPERERQTPYDITYMWNLKCDVNEPIYKTETDSQTHRIDFRLPRGKRVGKGCIGSIWG